jgi:RNA polymerase-binding transcription factor DksA
VNTHYKTHENPGLPTVELAALRERLHQERRFRLQQIQQLNSSAPTTPQDASGFQALWAHIQVHVELAVSAHLVLAEVKSALRRMDQGRYGSCHGCGDAIALARLQVMPQTRHCTLCHWVEETRR